MRKENLTNWCVYMHTNKQNNKKYIGISSNIKKRWANQGVNYYDQVFGLAIQKYGWDGFVHEILFENLTKEEACLKEKSKNPIEIFNTIANKDFVRIHGPEHHVLDGASLLTAFYNAGGMIELQKSLDEIVKRGLQMPGATCGMWGVCGAVSSMGAALSIIDGTGPLSTDASWGKHMEFTSGALHSLSKVGGPRCCKRDAYLSFQKVIEYVNENYDVDLESNKIECSFSEKNEQCIRERCPFFKNKKKKFK